MRRESPQEKKRAAYERDHYVDAEYPHAFRKDWPRKKARINRRGRRRAEALVRHARGAADDVLAAAEEEALTAERASRSLVRDRLRNSGVYTLRVRVRNKLERCIVRVGSNRFFGKPYSAEEHREAFAAFLRTLMAQGHTPRVRRQAEHFAVLLAPEPPSDRLRDGRKREWLNQFFRDEPAWRERLQAWIASLAPDAA